MIYSDANFRSPRLVILSLGFVLRDYDRLCPYVVRSYLGYGLVHRKVHCYVFRSTGGVYPLVQSLHLNIRFCVRYIFQYLTLIVQSSLKLCVLDVLHHWL